MMRSTSSTWASSTPTSNVTLPRRRKPPAVLMRVTRWPAASRARVTGSASSFWTTLSTRFMMFAPRSDRAEDGGWAPAGETLWPKRTRRLSGKQNTVAPPICTSSGYAGAASARWAGSAPAGSGLMNRVRVRHVLRITSSTVSTWSSSTAVRMVVLPLARKPPTVLRRVSSNPVLLSRLFSKSASSDWTIASMSCTAPPIGESDAWLVDFRNHRLHGAFDHARTSVTLT